MQSRAAARSRGQWATLAQRCTAKLSQFWWVRTSFLRKPGITENKAEADPMEDRDELDADEEEEEEEELLNWTENEEDDEVSNLERLCGF